MKKANIKILSYIICIILLCVLPDISILNSVLSVLLAYRIAILLDRKELIIYNNSKQ